MTELSGRQASCFFPDRTGNGAYTHAHWLTHAYERISHEHHIAILSRVVKLRIIISRLAINTVAVRRSKTQRVIFQLGYSRVKYIILQ